MLTCFYTNKQTTSDMSCKEERLQHLNALKQGALTITYCIMVTTFNCSNYHNKFHCGASRQLLLASECLWQGHLHILGAPPKDIMLTGVVRIATAELQAIRAHLIQTPINTNQRTTCMKVLKIASGLTKKVKEELSKQ